MPHDKDHYRCGLRKWSAFPILSRVSLCVSVLALLVRRDARLDERRHGYNEGKDIHPLVSEIPHRFPAKIFLVMHALVGEFHTRAVAVGSKNIFRPPFGYQLIHSVGKFFDRQLAGIRFKLQGVTEQPERKPLRWPVTVHSPQNPFANLIHFITSLSADYTTAEGEHERRIFMTRVDPRKLADVQELVDDITRVAKVDREALVYIKGYIQGRADQAQSADKPANQAG